MNLTKFYTVLAVRMPKNEKQVNVVALKLKKSPEEIITNLDRVDPSGKHTPWLLSLWGSGLIRLPEDSNRVIEALTSFKKKQNTLQQKDLNKYTSLHHLEEALESVSAITTKRQKGFQYNPQSLPGVKILNRVGNETLFEITNADSLAKMGLGTKWCTREDYPDCQSTAYIEDNGQVYLISENNRPKIQFTPDLDQFMDVNDEPVPIDAYRNILKGLEPILIKEPFAAVRYAKEVIKGRWPEAEPTILQDPPSSYYYALNVIKGRWPEAEPGILQKPVDAYLYALNVIKGRWPEAEPTILLDPFSAVGYANNVIKGRWPAAEPTILTNSTSAFTYSKEVIKGRWPEAEAIISTHFANWPKYKELFLSH
jgi:hypothetical protein